MTLEDVKEGDQVILWPANDHALPELKTVGKVLKKQIVLEDGSRFCRNTWGQEYGHSENWHYRKIKPASEENIEIMNGHINTRGEAIRRGKLQGKINNRPKNLTTDQLERIVAIIEEVKP